MILNDRCNYQSQRLPPPHLCLVLIVVPTPTTRLCIMYSAFLRTTIKKSVFGYPTKQQICTTTAFQLYPSSSNPAYVSSFYLINGRRKRYRVFQTRPQRKKAFRLITLAPNSNELKYIINTRSRIKQETSSYMVVQKETSGI